MSKADLRLVQQLLEAQIQEAASGKSRGDSIRIHQVADPLDMTTEAAARDLAVEMLNRESTLVRRLRAALDRAKDGSYGICAECEEEIAPRRLKAIPWAELCIHCAERAENGTSREDDVPNSMSWPEAA